MLLKPISKVQDWIRLAENDQVTMEHALSILNTSEDDWPFVLAGAAHLRQKQFRNRVRLCSIVNAKSGKCSQDCSFCAQSAHHNAVFTPYDFLDIPVIEKAARAAKSYSSANFSVVTSGKELSKKEMLQAEKAFETIKEVSGISPCASLGVLKKAELSRLQSAGLVRYHHNLETAESFYREICTTRKFQDNVRTIKNAKALGLEVCSGGIFGLGETALQRVELIFTLKELGVDCVPINFLNPIPGTPLEGKNELTPLICLRIIAMARYVLPKTEITVCGGRELNLGALQPLVFMAGASGMMTGDYLTTPGQKPESDLAMLNDLGLIPMEWDL